MSSSVIIAPGSLFLMPDPNLLLLAISQLGMAIAELKEIKNTRRELCQVDYAVRTQDGVTLGVRTTKEGRVEFVAQKNEAQARKAVGRIAQHYARLKVLGETQKQGYKLVKEEKLPNGAVRLVVQKWR